MPTVNEKLARFVLFILRLLGNKKIDLKQVKASMLLNDMQDKLIVQVRHTFPADRLRVAFIENIRSRIVRATRCVLVDFRAENWIKVVNEIKLYALANQSEIIDKYSESVIEVMMGSDIERAQIEYEILVAYKERIIKNQFSEEPQLRKVAQTTYDAVMKALERVRNT